MLFLIYVDGIPLFTLQWTTVTTDLRTVSTIKSKTETRSANINHALNAKGIFKHIQVSFHSGSEHQPFGFHEIAVILS